MKGCRPLSDQEINLVLSSFSGEFQHRDRAMFLLGIKTGFRVSEILSLTVKDVFQKNQILDHVTVQRRNMKRKGEGRTVILHNAVKEALKNWLDELFLDPATTPATYLFKSRKGDNQPIGRIQAYRMLNRIFELNDMTGKLGTHSMRKTFADRVYEKLGRDLIKTQRALAHKNINSTVCYLSFKEEEVEEAILSI